MPSGAEIPVRFFFISVSSFLSVSRFGRPRKEQRELWCGVVGTSARKGWSMSIPGIIGFSGAFIAAYAYYPQIKHLVSAHCSAGISKRAYALWFVSSFLVTINAFFIPSVVFILLGTVQIGSTGVIYVFSRRYTGQICSHHRAHPYDY